MDTQICNNTESIIPVITILPHRINFGVIAQGYLYQLKFSIQNNTKDPIRLRVLVEAIEHEVNLIRLVSPPEIVAPGLSCNLMLELTAEYVSTSRFLITVTQNVTNQVFYKDVEANIVNTRTFKHVKKSLTLQNRPIYLSNVRVVGNLPLFEHLGGFESTTKSSSFTDTALMDDDDIEDLIMTPMVSNVYWDPFNHCLRMDPTLGHVCVETEYSLEKSKEVTLAKRSQRLDILEEQGFLTIKSLSNMKETEARKVLEQKLSELNHSDEEDNDTELMLPSEAMDNDNEQQYLDKCEISHMGSITHIMSVTSILAMKREKMEQMRKETLEQASVFSNASLNDPKIDSMKTLNMIHRRMTKTVKIPKNIIE